MVIAKRSVGNIMVDASGLGLCEKRDAAVMLSPEGGLPLGRMAFNLGGGKPAFRTQHIFVALHSRTLPCRSRLTLIL